MQKDLSSVFVYIFIYPSGGIPELAEDPSLTTVVGGKKTENDEQTDEIENKKQEKTIIMTAITTKCNVWT